MTGYSLYSKINCAEGKQDELKNYLLEAARGMEQLEDNYCYVVGIDPEDPNAVYVYELWKNQEAHQASLGMEVFQKLIEKARPIITGIDDSPPLQVIGGKY